MLNQGLVTVSYVAATILFILSLGGLSNPETARRGNLYGMVGMAIAIVATVLSDSVHGYIALLACMAVGGSIGAFAAIKVKMTEMPELVAMLHSFVGLAAVLVGYASYVDPNAHMVGVERTIHDVETYLGIFIGAVTFSGSIIAFGKLSGRIGGKPMLLPARHWINLAGLIVVIFFGKLFLDVETASGGLFPLFVMTAIALAFGIHMVMAIGGATCRWWCPCSTATPAGRHPPPASC